MKRISRSGNCQKFRSARTGDSSSEDFASFKTSAASKPKHWRRSIYRYIVRTTPERFLTTLDCPDPANLTLKRLTTTFVECVEATINFITENLPHHILTPKPAESLGHGRR